MTRPLQVFIDDGELRRLEAWSRERGWTKSHAVRVALRALTRPRDPDPLLAASGMVGGLPDDLSQRVDSYLEETFIAKARPKGRAPSRRSRSRIRR